MAVGNSIVTNSGRTTLITYGLNSETGTQSDKFYIKEFSLLSGMTGTPVQTMTKVGLSGSVLSGTAFDVASRSLASGNVLHMVLTIPAGYSSGGVPITGVSVYTENASSVTELFAYGIFEGFNKVAGSELNINFDVQY